MKRLTVHLLNPDTPAKAGRFVGTIELPEDFKLPEENEMTQAEAFGLIFSVAEIEE